MVAQDATTVYFQPIIDLRTDTVFAYEALLRVRGDSGQWESPGKMLAAIDALPSLQRLPLHRRVLERVLPRCFEVYAESGRSVAVNLPATLLEDAQTVAMLGRHDGSGIILEILETAAIGNLPAVDRSVAILRDSGYRVAIDDYGTGYSTAALLATLPPVDIVKIDLVFATTERGRAMLPALCRVIRAAGASVIVEGVESSDRDKLVRRAGADYGQGYFYGVPAPYGPVNVARQTSPILMGTTRNTPIAAG
jgi:EAL domain-containing protein (putative c-di-GMP-specific phosphodiesterase class I)